MGRAGEWIPLATAPAGGAVSHVDGMTADEATAFAWSLFLAAADPADPADPATYFAGSPKDKVSPISCPDNVAFDAHGNL